MTVFKQRTCLKLSKTFLKLNKSGARNVSQVFLTLKPAPQTVKTICIGLGLGGIAGAVYVRNKNYSANFPPSTEYVHSSMLQEFPNVNISRQITLPGDTSGLKLTLFQYPTCPFCCKVRAFLDYFGICYNVVEVDPVLRQQIKWSQYKKVPILLSETENGYQPLYDSSMIISALTTYLNDKTVPLTSVVQSYPTIKYKEDGKEKYEASNKYFVMGLSALSEQDKHWILDERKWRMWADDKLVHTLSPNVYRTIPEAKQAFNWFAEVGEWNKLFPAWETLLIINIGAYAMWMISKKLKTRHRLKEDVRQSLYDECRTLTREIKNRKSKFLGGEKPNLADLSIYGVLSSIEGCIAFKDLLENTKIEMWYYDVKNQVQNHMGQSSL